MIIELKGGQAHNLGAQLMLREALRRISGTLPDVQIAVRQTALLSAQFRKSIGALRKMPLRKRNLDLTFLAYGIPSPFLESALGQELVVESQLDAIVDLSGFAYGDRWGRASIIALSAEIDRCFKHKKPYIFLPQAYGPFSTIDSGALRKFSRAIANASVIAIRDESSWLNIERVLTRPSNQPMLIPDITFAVQVEARQYDCRPVDQNTAVIIPNIRMLESQSYVLGAKSYLTKIMNLATVCRKQGFKPIILNHGGREDANLCSYLSRELGDTAVVQPRDPYLAKAMIGSAGVVVSSRYHGCVAALSQGIPCIATSWTHKYRELFLPFDLDYAVLGVEDAFDCDDERLLRKLFDDCASRVDALGAIRRDLIRRVESFWAVVFSALCRAG